MIEQLSGLALNVRKQTSPERRHAEPEINLTLVDTEYSPDINEQYQQSLQMKQEQVVEMVAARQQDDR